MGFQRKSLRELRLTWRNSSNFHLRRRKLMHKCQITLKAMAGKPLLCPKMNRSTGRTHSSSSVFPSSKEIWGSGPLIQLLSGKGKKKNCIFHCSLSFFFILFFSYAYIIFQRKPRQVLFGAWKGSNAPVGVHVYEPWSRFGDAL